MIVLDASVILKIFLEEPDSKLAYPLIEGHITGKEKIAAPELLYYELANVLATKTSLSLKSASSAFTEIFNLEIETFTLGVEEILSSISLSHKCKISVYDSSYLILADRLSCNFITADERLFNKTKDMKFVKLFKNRH